MRRLEQSHPRAAYRIESYGNGFAYEIRRKADGAVVFLQGDDALGFGNQLEKTCDLCSEDDVAAQLFD